MEIDIEALIEAPFTQANESEQTKSVKEEPQLLKPSANTSPIRSQSPKEMVPYENESISRRSSRNHSRERRRSISPNRLSEGPRVGRLEKDGHEMVERRANEEFKRLHDKLDETSHRSRESSRTERRRDSRERYERRSRERHSRGDPRDRHERRRSRDRYRSRERHERRPSRERYERRRSRDRYERDRHDHRERYEGRGDRYGPRTRSPHRREEMELEPIPIVDPFTRDQRTVFVTQLATSVTARDLAECLQSAGRIREAKVVEDKATRRSKGVGYVEFYHEDSVMKAIMMTGTSLMGRQIIVQKSESEKNKMAYDEANPVRAPPPMSNKLFVENLPVGVLEKELRELFVPFGRLDYVNLHVDPETQKSKGYAFVQYKHAYDAKHAMQKLDGLNILGKEIKVTPVSDKGAGSLRIDDESGSLDSINRVELMARLSRDGVRSATSVLKQVDSAVDASRSKCILLKNMFDPAEETGKDWDKEVEYDVKEECSKYGKVVYISVDRESKGHVYLKFSTEGEATVAQTSLHNRFFAGKKIDASMYPEGLFKSKFPDS